MASKRRRDGNMGHDSEEISVESQDKKLCGYHGSIFLTQSLDEIDRREKIDASEEMEKLEHIKKRVDRRVREIDEITRIHSVYIKEVEEMCEKLRKSSENHDEKYKLLMERIGEMNELM